jgi:flagellar biosynthesis component FlhA
MIRLVLLALFLFATASWAQEPASEEADEAEAAAETEELTEAEKAARERELIESVLEDEPIDYSGEDEKVFKPTDDVLYGQSVPFPPDI